MFSGVDFPGILVKNVCSKNIKSKMNDKKSSVGALILAMDPHPPLRLTRHRRFDTISYFKTISPSNTFKELKEITCAATKVSIATVSRIIKEGEADVEGKPQFSNVPDEDQPVNHVEDYEDEEGEEDDDGDFSEDEAG
ncbi:hypothetical protein RN001_006487 [Aquatica leii]|uniref:Uncharacterized protein n=1 Tax=Aquatica leii TaxID=1421715 RepID=A0AAN7SQ85_9COLE|nr:hypothetical protein RN001_006487 [Aquatica leii]